LQGVSNTAIPALRLGSIPATGVKKRARTLWRVIQHAATHHLNRSPVIHVATYRPANNRNAYASLPVRHSNSKQTTLRRFVVAVKISDKFSRFF